MKLTLYQIRADFKYGPEVAIAVSNKGITLSIIFSFFFLFSFIWFSFCSSLVAGEATLAHGQRLIIGEEQRENQEKKEKKIQKKLKEEGPYLK